MVAHGGYGVAKKSDGILPLSDTPGKLARRSLKPQLDAAAAGPRPSNAGSGPLAGQMSTAAGRRDQDCVVGTAADASPSRWQQLVRWADTQTYLSSEIARGASPTRCSLPKQPSSSTALLLQPAEADPHPSSRQPATLGSSLQQLRQSFGGASLIQQASNRGQFSSSSSGITSWSAAGELKAGEEDLELELPPKVARYLQELHEVEGALARTSAYARQKQRAPRPAPQQASEPPAPAATSGLLSPRLSCLTKAVMGSTLEQEASDLMRRMAALRIPDSGPALSSSSSGALPSAAASPPDITLQISLHHLMSSARAQSLAVGDAGMGASAAHGGGPCILQAHPPAARLHGVTASTAVTGQQPGMGAAAVGQQEEGEGSDGEEEKEGTAARFRQLLLLHRWRRAVHAGRLRRLKLWTAMQHCRCGGGRGRSPEGFRGFGGEPIDYTVTQYPHTTQ